MRATLVLNGLNQLIKFFSPEIIRKRMVNWFAHISLILEKKLGNNPYDIRETSMYH